ncbi:MAG TPA: hypothetical protein VE573_20510 [Nitrososphaeraceae archaeon]|jgi:hypothetical protein|nr:hypothetical protein [Nitrososphaeraceae archaeon]
MSNTIGHNYPEPIPVNPKFLKKCVTHPKDENPIIDPISEDGKRITNENWGRTTSSRRRRRRERRQ